MSRWFRFYSEALRNPKVLKLPDKEFRLWVRLLALAAENEGSIPSIGDLKHVLNMRLDHLSSALDRLISGGLIDALAAGYEPHNWGKFQYKSDSSTDRVTRHRAKRNVSETAPDTDSDTETERKKSNRAESAAPMFFEGKVIRLNELDFRRWEKAYPLVSMTAALQARDDWLAVAADEATRRKWFISTSNHLANLQTKAEAAEREADRAPIC